MEFTPAISIIISPSRARKKRDPEKASSLETDIDANGLYHPPVVRGTFPFTLVAGQGRLQACLNLIAKGKRIKYGGVDCAEGAIPVNQIETMDAFQALEIELRENLEREDLSWQDRTLGFEQLFTLRQSQAAAAGIPFSPADIVKEGVEMSGRQAQEVRDAIIISAHMKDPVIAKAASQKEAFKLIERKQRAFVEQELVKRLGAVPTTSLHTFLEGSCLTLLPTFPAGTFNGIVTDPPYGIGAHTFTPQGGNDNAMVHTYDDSFEYAARIVASIAEEGARICRPSAYVYMFCAITYFREWKHMFAQAGWDVWPYPIIWHKTNAGNLLGNCDGPRHVYECILYARRGGKGVNSVRPDVIAYTAVKGDVHAAEKPVDLLVDLISRSSTPGDTIIDPCCGSGSIFRAASLLQLKATGIELDPVKGVTAALRAINTDIPEGESTLAVPTTEGTSF